MVRKLQSPTTTEPAPPASPAASWFLKASSREANEIAGLSSFEAYDELANVLGVESWLATAMPSLTDFRIANEPAAIALTSENAVASSHSSSGDAPSADDAAISDIVDLFGSAGVMLAHFLKYLGTRTSDEWAVIRRLANDEYAVASELAMADSHALQVAATKYSPQMIGAAQYMARSVAFRGAWAAEFGNRESRPRINSGFEMDCAWPAWASDLARRAVIEILAYSVDKTVVALALSFLKNSFVALEGRE
jgi:hypothetical protein